MKKRISDRERLDWLQKNKRGVEYRQFERRWSVMWDFSHKTVRKAIDAEIKRSKRCGNCGKSLNSHACGPTHALRYEESRRAKRGRA